MNTNDLILLAKQCGGDPMYPPEHKLHRVVMPVGALDAFAESLLAEKDAEIAALKSTAQAISQLLADVLKHLEFIDRQTVYDARDLRERIAKAVQPANQTKEKS